MQAIRGSVPLRDFNGRATPRVSMMAPSVVSRRWMLRDMPQAYLLLVWVAFCFSIFFFFSDWSPVRQEAAERPQTNKVSDADVNDKIYTGSIIIVPSRGNRCWERMLDNRTGTMWDKGFVNCDEAVSQLVENKQLGTNSRLRLISKAFAHDKK